MRIDPIEVFSSALAITPLRILIAWLAGSVGAFLPAILGSGLDATAFLGWQIGFFPFYLLVVVLNSGWWAVVAMPMIIVLAFKMLMFLRNDNEGSDLIIIFSLSYFISIRMIDANWLYGVLVGILLVLASYLCVRRERERDPY
jgi:hypothetical protein